MTATELAKVQPKDHYVYVIRLDQAVLSHRKFSGKNPDHDPCKPCVYVGKSFRTPEERLAQHLSGERASRWVRKYGITLIPRQYQHLNPMTRSGAESEEVSLAERLRRRGYAVWQN